MQYDRVLYAFKFRKMEDKIRLQLKIKKVHEMKFPTILMSSNDFDSLKVEVKDRINDFEISDRPKYEGIPINVSDYLCDGMLVVYDDVMRNCI